MTAPTDEPTRVLLEAVRVLHGRGAHRIQVFVHIYALGTWRCPLMVDGDDPYAGRDRRLLYSSAQGWRLPGHDSDQPIDAEAEADCIWAVLTDDERTRAARPHPDYVAWYEGMLAALPPGSVPSLFDEWSAPYREGFLEFVGGNERPRHPLPPGDSLDFFLRRS